MGKGYCKKVSLKKNIAIPGLMALSLIFSLFGCGGKEDVLSAVTMRLQKKVGVVNLYDDKGAEQTIMEQMRLLSGQKITTAVESLIMVSLDETKVFTMEEKSKADIIKSSDGKNLEFNLNEGNLFFNVNEKLKDDQTMTVKAGNMICGIRGTSAYMGQNSSGDLVLMVTDGDIDVSVLDQNQNVQKKESAGPGSKVVVSTVQDASGNQSINLEKNTFKEEDLPPSALGAISSDSDLGERVTSACNFSDEKINALAEITTVKSSTGETIPIMGKAAEIINNAAVKAGSVAGGDLKLEVAIITGSKGALEKGQSAGLNEENLTKLVENTTNKLGECVATGLNVGIASEELIGITNVVAGSMNESIENMTTSGLAVDEVNQVITSMGNVFNEVIAANPASPAGQTNSAGQSNNAAQANVLARVNAVSEQVKNTVVIEMRRESTGTVTAEAVSNLNGTGTGNAMNIGNTGNAVNTVNTNTNTINTNNTTTNNESNIADNDNSGSSSGSGSGTKPDESKPEEPKPEEPKPEEPKPVDNRIVTFMDEDGVTVLDTVIIEKGKNPVYEGPAPAKASDSFKKYMWFGWTDGTSTYAKDALLPEVDSNIVYLAVYKEDYFSYTITYELDGGSINGSYNTGYKAGTGYLLPSDVVKADTATNSYTFEGWFTQATGGYQVWAVGVDETGNKTFYAHWIEGPRKYTTSLTVGSGGRTEMSVNGVETNRVAPGETIDLTIYSPDGYKVDSVSIAVNGQLVPFTGSGNSYSQTMPDEYIGGAINITFSLLPSSEASTIADIKTLLATDGVGTVKLTENLALNENLVIPLGKILDLNNHVLVVGSGATLTNNGTILAKDQSKLLVSEGGKLANYGTVSEEESGGITTVCVFSAGTVTGVPATGYQTVLSTGFYDWSANVNTNIWYRLDTEGLLYLEGSGDMTDQVTGNVGSSWTMIEVLPGQKSKVKSIIVSYGITSVSQGAFYEVPATSAELSSVKKIDKIAFYKSKVKTVNAPDAESIGYEAFYQCTDLEEFNIPNSVKTIGAEAFFGCSKLEFDGIPTSITSIGKQAFDGSKLNGEVVFPDSLTSIGDYAFENCKGITKVSYGSGMTSTGSHVFSGCTGISEVNLPSTVTTIGSYAFAGCSSLTSIDLSHVTSLGEYCFSHAGLTTLILPAAVESVPKYAFYECRSLKDVDIHAKSLGDQSFYYCQAIDDFYVGEELNSVGQFALSGNHIKRIHYSGTPEKWAQKGFNSAFTGDSTPTWTLICSEYSIMLPASIEHGTIDVRNGDTMIITSDTYGRAAPGTSLSYTVTLTPDEGYIVDGNPTVKAGDTALTDVTVTPGATVGVYTVSFTMPSASVTVGGAFKHDDTPHSITLTGSESFTVNSSNVTMTVDGEAASTGSGVIQGKEVVMSVPRPNGQMLKDVSILVNGTNTGTISPVLNDDGAVYTITFTMPLNNVQLSFNGSTPVITLSGNSAGGSIDLSVVTNASDGLYHAEPDGTVYIISRPDSEYRLDFTVTDAKNNTIDYTESSDGYSFTMPPMDVTISYSFVHN